MKTGTIYGLHPAYGRQEAATNNLLERTGKSIDEWANIVRREGPADEKEQRTWLKSVHGITSNYAMWIVEEAAGRGMDAYDPDALVEAQYTGPKESLRPIYDALLNLCLSMGEDVKACPCSTIVPLFRKHVFAQIKATTNTRVDLGFCLRGEAPQGRLVSTGGEVKGDRITHRIPITSLAEIDDEVRHWLKRAYDACP